jgi:hypothetical protein
LNIHPSGITQDKVCEVLLEKNAVTKENMTLVLKKFETTLPNYYTYFKPIGITFSEEISKILNEQLAIPLELFTPEKIEEVIEEEVTESEFAVEDNFEPEVSEEVTLEVTPELTNHQITEDEPNDLDWF